MARLDHAAILSQFEQNQDRLLDELSRLVHGLSSRFKLPAYLTPDDIAQEVLTVCYQKLRDGSFRGDCDVRTFVYRIAVNCCLTHKRETMTEKRMMDEMGAFHQKEPSPDAKLLSSETFCLVRKVIDNLPDKCRELWRMMLLERKNYSEVAKLLEVKEVTVRERMSSCRRKAREIREKLALDQHLCL